MKLPVPLPHSPRPAATSKVDHLAIIAGGKGTRLASVAGDVPKVLVPVGGKPVLQHQLELAASAGVREVTICAGHLADQIRRFVGDGSRFGLRVRILIEQESLGTAGAVLESLDSWPEHFFVLYGDVLPVVDLHRMAAHHLDRGADFTALVQPTDHPHDSDLVEAGADDWVIAMHPCPHPPGQLENLANAALYVARREALRPLAAGAGTRDFIKDVVTGLLASGGRVLAYRSMEYIKDMGTPERLRRVDADWQSGNLAQ
jgi:NDP-sugar pyrophosphorylase family protein